MKLTPFKVSEKKLSILNDPFQKDCITRINATAYKSCLSYSDKVYFQGWVEFKNNSTEGKQNFEADSFVELLEKMDAFVNEL